VFERERERERKKERERVFASCYFSVYYSTVRLSLSLSLSVQIMANVYNLFPPSLPPFPLPLSLSDFFILNKKFAKSNPLMKRVRKKTSS
jgi:hypothetical protein